MCVCVHVMARTCACARVGRVFLFGAILCPSPCVPVYRCLCSIPGCLLLPRFQVGVEGHRVAFIVSDDVVTSEAVFEDVNTLLNGGTLSGLWSPEEIGTITGELTTRANSVGAFTPQDILIYFQAECTRNLHIVACLSPLNTSFRCVWGGGVSACAVYLRCVRERERERAVS